MEAWTLCSAHTQTDTHTGLHVTRTVGKVLTVAVYAAVTQR